jgi:hypothetical protein
MRFVQKIAFGVASLLAPTLMSASAHAATIIGGGTSVKLTAAPTLTGLGLSFATFGTASATVDAMGIPTATFLITGGSINDATGTARIEHNGSGLNFTGGGKALSIGDFVINTSTNVLTGRVKIGATTLANVPLFNIGTGLSLSLTNEAAGAFTTVFGAPDLSGAAIGTASVNLISVPVPEPGTWGMLIVGFGIVGIALRSRQRQSALQTA